ncbi:MAG: translocation/assembly module TamB domain-containing protein, partial [Candidatus Marinimicrobia bacterium]|nr:translocation/assembly module TamB domain-containing protein [Candidatus Neomarinimicrobiota bacterium]
MKRWILSILMLLTLFCLLLFGFGSWVLRSTDGATWLLDAIANTAELQITMGSLEGRLADDLVINDLMISWSNGGVSVQRLHLDWDPFTLVSMRLEIQTLEIDQLVIHSSDNPDATDAQAVEMEKPAFSAADLALLPDWLSVEIADLQLRGLAYQDEEGQSVIIDEISGDWLWTRQQLKASKFNYLSPYVNLQGTLDWDLQKLQLEMIADIHLPDTLVDPQLFADIAVPIKFPGKLLLDGDWNNFSGPVSFGHVTEAGDTVWLSADARGSWQGVRFDNLQGRYLNGSLAGELDLTWVDSYRMHGQLTADELNPVALVADLDGLASFDVKGELLVPYNDQPLQASLDGMIDEVRLRGHVVVGQVVAGWQDGGLQNLKLDLRSEGARVVASGRPDERLDLDIDIADLSQFHSDLAGQLRTSGWLRRADDYLTGELEGSSTSLIWQEISFANLSFHGRHLSRQMPLEIQLNGQGLQYADQQIDTLQVDLSGSLAKHNLNIAINGLALDLDLQLTGEYQQDIWRAELQTLYGQTPTLGIWSLEEPADINWQSGELSLKHFSLNSQRGERVTLEVSKWGAAASSSLALTWSDLNHERFALLPLSWGVSGKSTGELFVEMAAQQPVSIEAKVSASTGVQDELVEITIPSMTAEMTWLEEGLALDIIAKSDANNGTLSLHLTSATDPSFSWPESGQIELLIEDVNLLLLKPLLPAEIDLSGVLHSQSNGYWQGDGKIFLEGQAGLSDSELLWQSDEGLVDAKLRQVDVAWQWQGDYFQGSLVAQLAKEGFLRSKWQLPLPARWPIRFVDDGALQVGLQGQLYASGLLSTLAPGKIQDLQGQIKSDLQLTGTWQKPVFAGHLSLTDAGAYLPTTGITIENLLLRVSLLNEQVRIEELSLKSGPGILTGSGQLDFDKWQLQSYHLVFKGDRLQVYNFPELQVLSSPDLTLSGNSESMRLHGSLLIPEMSLKGVATVPETLISNDVVIFEEDLNDRTFLPIDADVRIEVKLGYQVKIKAAGVETRLEGGGVVFLDEQHQIAAQGEVRLVDGVYKAYGTNLEIK